MAGIYIHIPFCKQACYYCDFHFSTSLKKKSELVQALVTELQLRKDAFLNTQVNTIYFGGGTPSMLSLAELEQIIKAVYANYQVSNNPEITLEANPDDLISVQKNSKTIFESYKNIGINRLSIGVQSFFESDLKLMNRAHNAAEAKIALEEATKYFNNVSVDLIYGIPGATNTQWLKNIETALAFKVPHISSYALTVEPKTALSSFIEKGLISPVDDALAEQQFQILVNVLTKQGFVNYELSNFGKPDYFSQNNTAYWQGKHYLGIGPSAHSFNGKQRGWNVRNNTKYIKALAANTLPIEWEVLSKTDQYNERIMTGLRTIWGVSLNDIEKDFGAHYKDLLLKLAEKHIQNKLLYIQNNTLLVTKEGLFLSDGIASDLFLLN
ncbi:radical SAM family heme chaperone HemW [Bizionia sediminis]|uniref:Heme chaperone HemW n=1 Tax=Bizionia sediminis TaxID=1737064 RepID=A0ABW5KS47_9FLAO